MAKNRLYGPEANAAAVRAALQCQATPEKVHAWKQFVFDLFGIKSSPNSYRYLLKTLREKGRAIEKLVATVADHPDGEELGSFLVAFLSSDPEDTSKLHESQSILKEAQLPLKVIDCEVKTMMDPEESRELIKYIDIPEQNFDELIPDIEYATHLRFLLELADEPPKTFILAAKQEVGLLACRYLSTLLTEDEENDYYLEQEEFASRVPIIWAQDLIVWHNSRRANHFGLAGAMGLEYSGEREPNKDQPWYDVYDEIPLIVVINSRYSGNRDFIDKIKILEKTHRTVWIICPIGDREESSLPVSVNYFNSEPGNSINLLEEMFWTLNYPLYRIDEPDVDSEYYQMVLKTAVAQHGYEIAPEVDLAELLKALKKRRGRKFAGNQTITELADKAIALKKKSTGTILQPEDFSFISQSLSDLWQNRPQEQNSAAISAVERMNKHIYGLEQIKKQVIETVNVLKLRECREKRGLTTDGLTTHNTCLFIGPPGVGKTEIAKCFAEILFEENLLPGKKFLNLNAVELKGQYVGHTAPRITQFFEEYDAIFLDEAYSLAASHNGQMDIFSQEALAQLCVELEEHARDKLVILAGYGGDIRAEDNKMWEFLRANPGIASRITFHFNFPRYSPDREMPEIFKLMAQNAGWILEEGWRDVVVDFFTKRGKDANYGNAREGRRLLEQAIVIQAGNLDFSMELSDDELKTLNCHGLKEATARILEAENHLKNPDKPPIGFR